MVSKNQLHEVFANALTTNAQSDLSRAQVLIFSSVYSVWKAENIAKTEELATLLVFCQRVLKEKCLDLSCTQHSQVPACQM